MYVSHKQHYNLTLYYTLLCAHQEKSSFHPSPYYWSPFPFPLYISPLQFPSRNHQSVLIFMFMFCFCSFILVFFIPHLSENTQYLSLTSFTWHNILKVYPYCHKLQDLILLMAKQYCIVYLYSKSSTVKQALFQECIGKSTLFISPT